MKEVADLLLFIIAIIALIFASITDIRKREVPNWLNYSLLAVALAIRGIAALLSRDFSYFYWALIAIAVFYVLGSILYYGKIFGGGDIKLLIALSACFATTPYFATNQILPEEPFLMSFSINTLSLGSLAGIATSIFLFFKIRDKRIFLLKIKKTNKNRKINFLKILCFFIALFLFIFVFVLQLPFLLVISFLILIIPYLYIYLKGIENEFFVRKVDASKLVEGDLLAESIKIGTKTIKPSAYGLTPKDIKLIKKAKKKVLIKQGIIFVPIILIALVISLFYGDLLLAIIKAFL